MAVITGNGRAFCAGADLRSRADGPAAASGVAGLFRTDDAPGFHEFDAKKPIIGAVNGYALGGGFEIALSCDLLIASEAATFGLPEITLWNFCGWRAGQASPVGHLPDDGERHALHR